MAKKKSKSGGVIAVLLVVLIAIIGAIGYMGYSFVQDDINGNRKTKTEYNLVITRNDYEYEIGQMLANNGIIKSDMIWTNWMSKNYPDFVYTNGEYLMNSSMSYEDIAKKLQNPDISHKLVKVAIPEGTNCMEIAQLMEDNGICDKSGFLSACKTKEPYDYDFLSSVPDNPLIAYQLEGFLFPATYDLGLNTEPKEVVETMLDAFENHLSKDMTAFCEKNNMTLYELLTLASVVQEEALGANSGGKIASVFINRLEKGSKLQSDVTYFYAADLRDKYGFSQEVYDSYYTYRCPGLPSGPITNSGDEIIDAVVNHPDTEYLYFFSDLQQEFHFANDYDEFVALQEKYPWK